MFSALLRIYSPVSLPAPPALLPVAGARYAWRLAAAPVLPPAFDPFLYLTPAYLALNSAPGEALFFYLEDQAQTQTVAQWPVVVQAETAFSPWQAPFGGVQLTPGLPAEVVRAFLAAARAALTARGVRQVQLRPYPASYDPAASALLAPLLAELDCQVTPPEESHALLLSESFEAELSPAARAQLAASRRHGLQTEQETPLLLPLAYEHLQRWYQEKGRALPLSLAQLQAQFRTFPDRYFLFSVRAPRGEWAALAVLVSVNERVLSTLLAGSAAAYDEWSPLVLLAQGLHGFGQASGAALLDVKVKL